MTRQEKAACADTQAAGQQKGAASTRLLSPMVLDSRQKRNTQTCQATTELGGLRRRYNAAIVAENWQEAAALQRAYRQAEKQRRRELLDQAQGVIDG